MGVPQLLGFLLRLFLYHAKAGEQGGESPSAVVISALFLKRTSGADRRWKGTGGAAALLRLREVELRVATKEIVISKRSRRLT